MRARHGMVALLVMGIATGAQANDAQTHFNWFKRLCLESQGKQDVIAKAMAGLESSGHAIKASLDQGQEGWKIAALSMEVMNPAQGLCAVSSTTGKVEDARTLLEREGYDFARTKGLEWLELPRDNNPTSPIRSMDSYQLLEGDKPQAQVRLTGTNERSPTTQYRFVYIAVPKE